MVLLFHYKTHYFSFLSTFQAQILKCYRQNPRVEARLKNECAFLLNTMVVYLGLTLVVS